MRRPKEKKNTLSCSIVLSTILHVVLLFSFIILGSVNQIIKLNDTQSSEIVNAIMIDPDVIIEQYNQLQWKKNNTEQTITEQKKSFQEQEKELLKQQKQGHLKMMKKEYSKIEQKAEQKPKKTEESSKKAKQQKKIAKDVIIRTKIEQEQLINKQIAVKLKTKVQPKKEAKITEVKNQANVKEKAKKTTNVLINKTKTNTVKQTAQVNDLIGNLIAQQLTEFNKEKTRTDNQKKNIKINASSSNVAHYVNNIKAAIQSKFYDADIYHGKTCELSIKLAPNGMLISIAAKSNNVANDPSLCDAAIRSAKAAIMPKPPNRNIYDAFNKEGNTLIFKP